MLPAPYVPKDEPVPAFADRLYAAKTTAAKAMDVNTTNACEPSSQPTPRAPEAPAGHKLGKVPGYLRRRKSDAAGTEEQMRVAIAAAATGPKPPLNNSIMVEEVQSARKVAPAPAPTSAAAAISALRTTARLSRALLCDAATAPSM